MKINTLDFDAQTLQGKILNLAIRGKLVPQDPNDEPANVLLDKIHSEKEKLIKEKKIKKIKSLPEIFDIEKPFDIPQNWKWVRLGDISNFVGTGMVVPTSQQFDTPTNQMLAYFKMNNIGNWTGKFGVGKWTYVLKNEKSKNYILKPGQLLFNTRNSRELVGKTTIVPKGINKGIIANNNILRIESFGNMKLDYINYYLISPFSRNTFLKLTAATTNVAAIYQKQLSQILIPLPPLAEQKRIADKISQLFDQIDKIESASQQYTELQSSLRFKVLDVAIHGKLVEQNSTDEPASVLLDKIKSEKAELIKEKKIKKSKPLPEITDDERPFDIPNSWEWVRLGEICLSNIGLTYKPAQKSKAITKTKILRANNIKACQLNKDNLVFLNLDSLPEKYYLRENDILMAVRSGSKRLVGKSAIVTSDFNGFSFGAFMSKIRIIRASSEYVYYFLNSNFFRSQLGDANTTTINQITQRMINSFVLPLPPLEEQKRIVKRLRKIFSSL